MSILIGSRAAAQPTLVSDSFFRHYISSRYDSAYAALTNDLKRNPDDAERLFFLGKTCLVLGQPERARSAFQRAQGLNPADARIKEGLAHAFEEQGMTGEAIDMYRTLARQHPERTHVHLKLASLLMKQRDYGSAVSVLRPFMSSVPMNPAASALLARAYIKTAVCDSAVMAATLGMAGDSTSFPVCLNLGIALYMQKSFESAATALEQSAKLSSLSDEPRYYLGQTYLELERFDEAIQQFKECADRRGSYMMKALQTLTIIQYQQGRLDECIQSANSFLEHRGDEYKALVSLYKARALSDLERFNEAGAQFETTRNLSDAPFVRSILFYHALNHFMQNEYPEAIKMYRRVITLDPKSIHAYYNLALVYDDYYADKTVAIQAYEKFLSVAGNTPRARKLVDAARQRLRTLREKHFFDRKH